MTQRILHICNSAENTMFHCHGNLQSSLPNTNKMHFEQARVHSHRLANTSQLQVQSCRLHLITSDVFFSFFFSSPAPSSFSLCTRKDRRQKAFSLSAIISEGFSRQNCFLTKDERQTYRESIHFLETGTRPYLHSSFLCLC